MIAVWRCGSGILSVAPELLALDFSGHHRGPLPGAGKGGEIYLVDVGRLGGVGGELARLDNCRGFGGGAVTRVGPGAVAFIPCSDGILQVTIGPDDRLTRG